MKIRLFLLSLISLGVISFLSAKNIIINSNNKTELKIIENTDDILRLKNRLSDLSLSEIKSNENVFVKIGIDGYGYSLSVGDPELPVLKKLIEIPYGATVETEIVRSSYNDYYLPGLGITGDIVPSHGPLSKLSTSPENIEYQKNAKTYKTNDFSNKELVKVTVLGTMRDIRIGRLEIAPVQYNPVTKILRVFDDLELKIIFNNGNTALTKSLKKKYFSPFYENIRSRLINYKPLSPDELITSSPVTYVIISDPMFYDDLQPFIQWKTRKGFRVITGYTDDPAVGNTTESIKAYLENLYNDPPEGYNPQSFILFVGDVDQVPSFSVATGYHLTDLYYAEYTGDIFPECYYGRFSANSPDELEPQISKTLEYEMYQFPDPVFLDSVLLVAGVAPGYDSIWGNGQLNYMTNYYLNQTNGIFPYIYTPPFSPDTNYTEMMIERFNNGVSFVNYTGHCSMFGFSSPPLNIGNIPDFTNEHRYPLVVGNCCSSASFYMTCFGEEIVRAQDKGALAFIGAANSTYWDEDYWWMVGFKEISSNPQYNSDDLGLIDRWFHSNGEPETDWYITQGQMVSAGNLAVTQAGSTLETYYWEAYNLLGDPSVMIYVPEPPLPAVSYEPSITPGTEMFVVNTEPYMYAAISKDSVLHGAALADENGIAEIEIFTPFTEPGMAEVIVTGQNRQPYFGTVTVEGAEGVFVLLKSFEIDDSSGNNDGKADAGENIKLNVTLYNFGNTASTELNATLSSADTNVVIIENTNTWPPIDPGVSQLKNDAFSFDVNESVVNGHIVHFDLEITDGTDTWNSTFTITLHSLITEVPESNSIASVSNINIYPNPFTDHITLEYELSGQSDVMITVIDMYGNQYLSTSSAYRQSAGKHKITMNTDNLPQGVYLCKIEAGDYTVVKKIVR